MNNDFKLTTPVLVIAFNRPEIVAELFRVLCEARPTKLFVVVDGPRRNIKSDIGKCKEVEKIVAAVDWECDLKTLFREENMGCSLSPSGAISWFFSHVDEGIILEDDCIPNISFFRFCQELLEKYRDDQRIMMISGNDFGAGDQRESVDSYYFSWLNYTLGWATWKRAWTHFDIDMKLWPEIRDGGWLSRIFSKSQLDYWTVRFNMVYEKKMTTAWDYQWMFACLIQNGLSIRPKINLVRHIGCTVGATHSFGDDYLTSIPAQSMDFPLKHPQYVMVDYQMDELTFKRRYSMPLFQKIKKRMKVARLMLKKYLNKEDSLL